MAPDRRCWIPRGRRTATRAGWAWVLIPLAACGCASQVPAPLRDGTFADVPVTAAQQAPERHEGQRVRWGGSVLSVQNGPESTLFEVLARPLDARARPLAEADGLGRFLAEVPGFKDPAEYPEGRLITLVGVLQGVQTRPVGEFQYVYPLIAASGLSLWPEPPPVVYVPVPAGPPGFVAPGLGAWYGRPFGPWYGPWYDPWYPGWW